MGLPRMWTIHDGSGAPQLRLSYTADSIYTDIWAVQPGYLSLLPSANRVGINNSIPTQALDVTGNGYFSSNISFSGAYLKTNQVSARDLTVVTGASKTVVLDTPVWDDMVVVMSNVKAPAANAPVWTPYKGSEVPAFKKDATNTLYFATQLSHAYKEGSNIEFHIHIAYPDNLTGNSTWYFTYSWANVDGTFPPASNSGNVVVVSPSTVDYHQLAQMVASIDGTGKTVSSVLLCSISRLGGVGADNYDNVIYLMSGDFHFLKDTIGSRTGLAK
jgi:hypothetical protein